MIPSVGMKVQKEEGKNEQKKIPIVRKGDMPFSGSESSFNSDNDDLSVDNYKLDIERKKPNRVIQKSTVVKSNHSQASTNDYAKAKQGLSKRAQIRNKLIQKELESSSIPQSEDKSNELLNYIHDDNNNDAQYLNAFIKEDVLDIKSFNTSNAQNNNTLIQINQQKGKSIIEYESLREKELMEKYVLHSSDSLSSYDDDKNYKSQHQNNIRPMFVSKDRNQPPHRESELDKESAKAVKQKQLNTSIIIRSYIQKDLQLKNVETDHNNIALPDDTDVPDDLEEYEQWKIRELKRIKRQMEENEVKIKSKIEIERRRNLTNEQRQDENMKLGSDATLKNFKSRINYLQKYYHKGAFYQDEASEKKEHIYNRDFNLPTWEDKVDRSVMPNIMAKRRGKLFKKGQTKYTHLTNEDTTNFDPAFRVAEPISKSLLSKSAAYKSMNKFNNK